MFCLLQMVSTAGQAADGAFETFQRFVNGQIPVAEVVVHRQIASTNGHVTNHEWWRCGWQSNTWYCQRLTPAPNNPAKLVPLARNEVVGESRTHGWIISDQNVHLVARTNLANSILDTHGAFPRDLLFRAISLGIPRIMKMRKIEDAPVVWSHLEFQTTVTTAWGPSGVVVSNSPLVGKVLLNERGCPGSAEFPDLRTPGRTVVVYEYNGENEGIPSAFIVRYPDAEYRYEFLSLDLMSPEYAKGNEYVPSMFADPKLERFVTIWTNSNSYSLVKGKMRPNFGGKIAGQDTHHVGLFILISLAAVSGITLALWYRRSGHGAR